MGLPHKHAHGHSHSHGAIDPTIASTAEGLRATSWSFIVLLLTGIFQVYIVYITGSVALLADTIHNFADAGTAIPLWIAFTLARRPPSKRFTYGLGRVEDLAGIAIVLIIAFSAAVAGIQSVQRLMHPTEITHLGALMAASILSFIGNEIAAVIRLRTGRKINSAALIADGYHALIDGLTSLAVLAGALGVYFGYPLADPIAGLVITVLIIQIVWQSAKTVFVRSLDGVEPAVIHEIEHALEHVEGITAVNELRARWIGHKLWADVVVTSSPDLSLKQAEIICLDIENEVKRHLTYLAKITVRVKPVLLLLLAFFLQSTIAAADPAIRIGYITDLTGRGAFLGTQSVRGVKVAESELPGLKVIVEDTGGESTRALSAATKLIDFDRVDAILCDLTPICTPIAGKVASSNKPLIYLSPATSIAKRYPYAYRNFIDYFEGCQELSKVWKRRGLTNVAVLAPHMEFGDLCVDGFEAEFSGQRVIQYIPGDDLRTPMTSLRAAGSQAVLHVGYEPDFLNWFKLCKAQQFQPTQGFMEVMLSKAIRGSIGDDLPNHDLIGYEDLPVEFIATLDRLAPLEGGDFNRQAAAMAYNGIRMLERAFQACPDKTDMKCIDKSLRSPPIPGLFMGFRGWKDQNAPYPVVIKKEK